MERLTFLAGKGGVGKTTCAASLALQIAKEKRCTAISVDPAHTLRDVFAREKPPSNLKIETINTRDKWLQFRESLGEEIERAMRALAPKGMTIDHDGEVMQKLVEIAPPGADELFAITRLADLIADTSQEPIIVDTAPTGHFLRLIRDIPVQVRGTPRATGTDANVMQLSREGVATGLIGIPNRYMHSPVEVVDLDDLDRAAQVLAEFCLHVTPQTDCSCDRSMRSYELDALRQLGAKPTIIERRDGPPTSLTELAALLK